MVGLTEIEFDSDMNLDDDDPRVVGEFYYDCPSCGFEEAVYADEPNVGEYWWDCSVCGLAVPLRSHLKEPADVDELDGEPVVGFPDYVAGVDGFVYRKRGRELTRLSGVENSSGYLTVWLYADGVRKTSMVHHVICRSFHGEPEIDDPQVRHMDGDRLNNAPENLQWGTRSDNMQDAIKDGSFAKGSRHGGSKLDERAVREILEGECSVREASANWNVSPNTIRSIRKGKSWKHVWDAWKRDNGEGEGDDSTGSSDAVRDDRDDRGSTLEH